MKGLFEILVSKVMIRQYVLAAILLFFSVIGISFYLEDYTLHNEEITVPDLKGLSLEEAIDILEGRNLRYVVEDSSYVKGKAPNVILDQNPMANFKVKDNRTIYLEINSSVPPKIALPNLIDLTLRMARNQIHVIGLKEDKLEYRPDIAKDVILGVKYKGQIIEPGTKLVKGNSITFVVGAGQGNQKNAVPNLYNLTVADAIDRLFDHSLNIGNILYDSTVVDTQNAKVFEQFPKDTLEGGVINRLKLGEFVDILVTQEIVLDSLESMFVNDSTEINQ